MKCPELSEVLDLIENRLDTSSRKRIESHVLQCAGCTGKKEWAERTMTAMKNQNQLYDAPEYAIQKAAKLLPARKQGLGDWILAKLDFDSWMAPATAGVRAEDRGPRQCVYVTDAYRVYLMLEAGDKNGRMVGQLVANSASAEPSHCLVEVSDSKKVLGKTITGESGEFLFEVPRNKNLQLKIHGDPESVLISCRL